MHFSQSKAVVASRIGVFAALYVVTSLIPVSMFIGAPSFLALNLIITPVMAILLPPLEAFLASLFGGIIGLYLAPSQAMFGPFTILLPLTGATFGSLTYHKKKVGAPLTVIYLITAISAYLIRNHPFPYFVAPHTVAVIFTLAFYFKRMTPLHMVGPLYTFISTMCEQGMMMIFAVHLLGLPWEVFPGILPLMVYERIIGAVGGSMIVFALMKTIPKYFTASFS